MNKGSNKNGNNKCCKLFLCWLLSAEQKLNKANQHENQMTGHWYLIIELIKLIPFWFKSTEKKI